MDDLNTPEQDRRPRSMAETPIDADLSEEEQVVAALVAGGAAFAALGGATLMLTEAVENSDDAILEMPNQGG